jgi:hypothetical protein
MIIVLGTVLFCVFVYFSTYFCAFHCILTVPPPKYIIILLLLPNILYRCCCYSWVEYLSKDMWKESIGSFLFIGFPLFSTHFQHFSVYSSSDLRCYTHTTHLYLSHWTCNHSWIAFINVLFCMSCYYHSHLIIPYLAQILGFWVTCGVKMMSLCHGWCWQPPLNCFPHPY